MAISDIILLDSARDNDVLAKFCCSVTLKITNNNRYNEVLEWLKCYCSNQFISTRVNSRKPFKFLFMEEKHFTMFIMKWC